MLKSEKQKIITLRLDEVLKPLGFRREIMDDIRYLRRTEGYVDSFFFFLPSNSIEGMGYCRGYKEIADILWEVEKNVITPYIQLWRFKKEQYIMAICDHSVTTDWGYYGEDSFDLKLGNWLGIDSPEAVNAYLDWYIGYLLGEGQEFLDYYSYLPNVLKKMDELDEKGISWWADAVGILPEGQPYFTGLIISKLCNDPKYDEKLERLNAYYSKDENEEDLPAFEKLKEILEHVEPRYNM